MKTEKHIAALLYRHQCVTVPGFGAFLSEWQSAQISEGQNSFTPPRKLISFNANIKTNDGLLANHIALSENISYDAALSKITIQVDFWQEKLKNKENISLENIGDVFVNSENNLVFKPNHAVNYLIDSFGLASFNSPEIQREHQSVEQKVIVDETPVISLVDNQKEEVTIVAHKPNTNWLKYAAAVALFATAGTYGYKMYYDYTIDQQTQLVQKNVQEKVNQTIQQATFIIPSPSTSVDLTIEEAVKPYHIIAGAFRNEANAKKVVAELKAKGYDAHTLPLNRFGLIPVAFGSFRKLEEAQKLKIEIKQDEHTEAWLLID
ncbi:MAG: hypothetical protein RLY43_1132 [Bacteroidota bacterium]|mgnify:FL=1|jgi:nucleoid DNA-binding protein